MKNLLWPIILFSLGLNVVLAWRISAHRTSSGAAAVMAAPVPRTTTKADDQHGYWARLQPDEPATLVGRLHAAGFPPEVVRAIIQTKVAEEFQERRKALDPEAASRPFWKRNQPDAKLMTAQRQLARDQEARLKELLGPGAESNDPMSEFQRTRQFGELPPEKMAQVQLLQREFSEKQSDLFATGGGIISISSAIGEKMMELQRQQRDALAKILTPPELEAYDIRNSSAGMNVRMRTTGMDLTEQEFRTLFQLQDTLEQQYSMRGPAPPSPDVMRQRNEAEQQMNEQIKRACLGPRVTPTTNGQASPTTGTRASSWRGSNCRRKPPSNFGQCARISCNARVRFGVPGPCRRSNGRNSSLPSSKRRPKPSRHL
jgi:hypothetical protein